MGCITHKDALITDVIWGALDRHHSLGWEAEIIPLERFTSKHAQKYKTIVRHDDKTHRIHLLFIEYRILFLNKI